MPLLRLSNNPDKQFAFVYFLAALGLWAFVWSHAWGMDMTHDEAYSYFLVKTHYYRAMPGSANTHWLNSFFMTIWQAVFGDDAPWLRIHSILAFPFFARAVFLLGKEVNSTMGRIAFYALVLFNPYLLDFFSLARGYGMAITFQAWSLVWFIRAALVPFNWRLWRWVLLFNTLTLGANLSYFYVVVGMAAYPAWLLAADLVQRRPVARGLIKLIVLYALLLLLTVADLLFIKYYGKDLGFGGDKHFVFSLFGSVWRGSLYRVFNPDLASWLSYVTLAAIGGFAGWFVAGTLQGRQVKKGLLLAIPVISILTFNIIFHFTMQTPYLRFRTALQWYVPGMLLICYGLSCWKPRLAVIQWGGTILAGVTAFVFVGQFFKQAHRQWCYEWLLQANSKQALIDLYAQQPKHPAIGYSLSAVYTSYYRHLGDQYIPAPAYLHDEGASVGDTALIRMLKTSDYIVTGHAVTLQCLEKLGLPYDVISEYAPGPNVLIRLRK